MATETKPAATVVITSETGAVLFAKNYRNLLNAHKCYYKLYTNILFDNDCSFKYGKRPKIKLIIY
jgi:hypothetical protein